jgi:hypothetical protein
VCVLRVGRSHRVTCVGVTALTFDPLPPPPPHPVHPCDPGTPSTTLSRSAAQVFGGTVTYAGEIVHGKTSPMHHDGKGLFAGR